MRLVVDKFPKAGIHRAVFMWEEGPKDARKKVVESYAIGSTIDVDDKTGHEIMAKYGDLLKMVWYGDGPAAAVETKAAPAAPKNVMLKTEKTKDVGNA
jgi:hypothetical protein